MVCHCFQQWSMKYSQTRRSGSGRPRSTDASQVRHILEQWYPPEQHPRKKSGHMSHLLSSRTIANRLLAAGFRSRVPLARLPLTKHGYSGVAKVSTGEWNGALLSSVMRVGSVCMRVMDVHVNVVDLVSVNFRSVFANDTQAPLQASWCGDHQLQLAVKGAAR